MTDEPTMLDPDASAFVTLLQEKGHKSDDKVDWLEDTLYGRYEVSLMLDTGTPERAQALVSRLREFAATLEDALGFQIRTSLVIGSEQKRLR